MTEIEEKALALVNEVLADRGWGAIDIHIVRSRYGCCFSALHRAIQAHEADKKAFSDAMRVVHQFVTGVGWDLGDRCEFIALAGGRRVQFADFIIPDPEPDPLVEVSNAIGVHRITLEQALAARGYKIERIDHD